MFQLKIGEYVLNCKNANIYSEDLYKNIEHLKRNNNKNTEMLFLQLTRRFHLTLDGAGLGISKRLDNIYDLPPAQAREHRGRKAGKYLPG
ncbi:MAG: hypothetical protein HGA50_09125 [Deltaproteobacteria bacterium]|nr:hypothetical protein [Deltaproteobacteria bacterium]